MNTAERKSSACEDRTMERSRGWCRGFGWHKKQGRRRSITLTALPAPDIEIGLRHPVNYSLARNRADECDPFHSRYKKLRPNCDCEDCQGDTSAPLVAQIEIAVHGQRFPRPELSA